MNSLPGDPFSPETDRLADNDYYFQGTYTSVIQGVVDLYGAYDPVGEVGADEEAAERAFAGNDNDLRYHFNLPATLKATDLLSVTLSAAFSGIRILGLRLPSSLSHKKPATVPCVHSSSKSSAICTTSFGSSQPKSLMLS